MIRLALIGLVVLLAGCGSETAKWQHARALNLYEKGDVSGALELLEAAYEQSPENESIQLDLARLYAEDGQCELGIGLCKNYLENHPDDVRGLDVRSTCRMCLGHFEAALEDYKKSISGYVSRSTGELNDLAYCRGLAEVELDLAARDIQKAIVELELRQGWGAGAQLSRFLSLQTRTVIAAGLISRHIDRHDEAIKFLDEKIELYDQQLDTRLRMLKNRITIEARKGSPFSQRVEDVLLNDRSRVEILKTSIAAMSTVRALIYEDLNRSDQSDSDRHRVKSLGFDFQSLVNDLPSDFNCTAALDLAATYLDTRGFVLGRLSWKGDKRVDQHASVTLGESSEILTESSYLESLQDLDLAVLAAQFQRLAMDTDLVNKPDLPPAAIEKRKKSVEKTTAVLLHHRREVHLRGGNKCEADKDSVAIEKLGFKDSSLY